MKARLAKKIVLNYRKSYMKWSKDSFYDFLLWGVVKKFKPPYQKHQLSKASTILLRKYFKGEDKFFAYKIFIQRLYDNRDNTSIP